MTPSKKWLAGQADYETSSKEKKLGSWHRHISRIAQCFNHLIDYQGAILDVGCGNGLWGGMAYEAARMDYINTSLNIVTGLDPLPTNHEQRFIVEKGYAEDMPFSDSMFDAVVFATSLDHIEDPAKALQESHRVLKPTGKLFIWNSIVISDAKPTSNPHINLWFPEELSDLVSTAGFRVFFNVQTPTLTKTYMSILLEAEKNGKN